MKQNAWILFILLTIYAVVSQGQTIIRDAEIEETINLIAEPIIKAAKLKNVKIYLINDNALNAFTTGAEVIYLYSGMISQFPDVDVIRGVIAHEIGHILGKHVVRQTENINTYNKVALSTIVIGLASCASSHCSLGTAIEMLGLHYAERSVLAYSRVFESLADQTALRLLEQSGCSSRGLIEFFKSASTTQYKNFINQYEQTHPLSQERLIALKNFYANSQFKEAKNSAKLTYQLTRSAAKLSAFTDNPKALLANLPPKLPVEIINYIKAICYFRTGDLTKSRQYINDLLILRPDDAFYHELKGQILFAFGKRGSLNSYIRAAKLRPNDLLIKFSKAIVGITVYEHDPLAMTGFYQDLKLVAAQEPDNLLALYYLAFYYDKIGKKAESLLNSALLALKSNDTKRAKRLAQAAIKDLTPYTPSWYKANDIIITDQ